MTTSLTYVLAAAVLAATCGAPRSWAEDPNDVQEGLRDGARLQREYALDPDLRRQVEVGFEIAPVPLSGDRSILVGLGSYIVNAQGGCNDCHTNPSYAPGGDPFLGQPKKINAAGYLAGGQQFGPGIVSRNLTPQNGLPAGRTYAEFKLILRTGIDLDNAHPQLGPLLQAMPWPTYQSMTDRDLRAIYSYLSVIPTIASPTQ